MRKATFLLIGLALVLALTLPVSPVFAQSNPVFVPLPANAKALYYRPDNNPSPQVAILTVHRTGNKFNALECTERAADGSRHYFAWLTGLPVGKKTVEEIAQKGGRYRWKIENEGFNRQKNSGLNLEHVYSIDPENWKAYYLLLQIAFVLTQSFHELRAGQPLRQRKIHRLAKRVVPDKTSQLPEAIQDLLDVL